MKFFSLVRYFEQRWGRQQQARGGATARRLVVEALESRNLLSNYPTIVASGVLPVSGSTTSSNPPTIQVTFSEQMGNSATTKANYVLLDANGDAPLVATAVAFTDGTDTAVNVTFNSGAPLQDISYTLYVRGDKILSAGTAAEGGTALPLSIPGEVATSNQGSNNLSVVNLPSDASGSTNNSLPALSNYNVSQGQLTTPSQPFAVALANVDGNTAGINDLIVADQANNQIDIYQGQAPAQGGGFSATPTVLVLPGAGDEPTAIAIGAFVKGSSLNDIAVVDSNSATVTVYVNQNTTPGVIAFDSGTNYATDGNAAQIAVGQVVGSGNLDIVVSDNIIDSSGNYNVSVLTGNGDGTFNTAVNIAVGTASTGIQSPNALAVGSLNDNKAGLPDIVVSGATGGTEILANTSSKGTPSFNVNSLSTTTFNSFAIGPLQFNNTKFGNQPNDIVGAVSGANQVQVFTNNGSGSFTAQSAITVPAAASTATLGGIAIGKTTGSGLNDIVVTVNQQPGQFDYIPNTATSKIPYQFGTPVAYTVDDNPVAIALGNVNSTNNLGVVTANLVSTKGSVGGDISVYQGNGALIGGTGGPFITDNNLTLPGATNKNPQDIISADLNNDGIPDLIVINNDPASKNSFVTLYQGNADGTFQAGVAFLPQFGSDNMRDLVDVAVGAPVQGGAFPDIFVLDQNDNSVGILQNNLTKAGATIAAGAFTALQDVAVGNTPTQLAVGYFGNVNTGGLMTLDLAVAHDQTTGKIGSNPTGVSILLGNGDGTFGAATEFASTVAASAIALGNFTPVGSSNPLDFVVTDFNTGNLSLYQGDGTGNNFTLVGGPVSTGLANPDSIAIADFNLDGFPDVVVASGSDDPTNTATEGVSVLLNEFGTGFGSATVTNFAPGVALQSISVADLNHDGIPDILATTVPGQSNEINTNLYTLNGSNLGNNNFIFTNVHPYLVGFTTGFATPATTTPTDVTIVDNPWIQVTTFTVGGNTVQANFIINPNFATKDLDGIAGSLVGWTTYALPLSPGSNGSWQVQTGTASPASDTKVAAPPVGQFQAMLDEANQQPITPGGGGGGKNSNSATSYEGSEAIYQDFTVPTTTTTLSLSLDLSWISSAAFTNTSGNPNLDFRGSTANQQIRVDIMDPTLTDTFGGPLGTTGATGVLDSLFITLTTTPKTGSITVTDNGWLQANLASLLGRTIRLRIASTNNQGQLIVGLDGVTVTGSFQDLTPPTLANIALANPGYMFDDATGSSTDSGAVPHTTNTTIDGVVSSIGTPTTLKVLEFDATDSNFTAGQFKTTNSWDAQGNFAFTYLGLSPGLHTIYIRAEDNANNFSTVSSITFFVQSTSFTDWQAVGPNAISTSGQGVGYTSVSGRITALAVDPNDPSGNHIFAGSANAGVWESFDGGKSWTPELEYATDGSGNPVTVAVGAIGISKLTDNVNPAVIYVGTGIADLEPDSRAGVGLFESVDGGQTFTFIKGSDVVFGGARISAIVVDSNNANSLYVGVASGGEFGPGVYYSSDGGATWLNTMNPSGNMFTQSGSLIGGTVASVTSLIMDPNNSTRIIAGLGNIDLATSSATGGVWLLNTTPPPVTAFKWVQQLGGENTALTNAGLPSGTGVGRVTLAMPSEAAFEQTLYVVMANPPANPAVNAPTINYGSFMGLYKTSNNLDDFTKVGLFQNTSTTKLPVFSAINLLGSDASNAGALLVDPTDPNVVYFGGSTEWDSGSATPQLDHAFVRIDTGNMVANVFGATNAANDGDDQTKAAQGAAQGGYYDPAPASPDDTDPYVNEGVSWYDLIEGAYGGNGKSSLLPPSIQALAVDPAGGLYIGTLEGVWRGQALAGFGYDFSSGGQGILAKGRGGQKVPSVGGLTYTSLNNNLQISSLTSVAIDPSQIGHYYITQLDTGSSSSTATSAASGINWATTGLTGPVVGGHSLGIISAGSIQISSASPTDPAGTPPTIYRTWEFANTGALEPEVSTNGGKSFNGINSTGINTSDNAYIFPAFAIDPNPVFDSGQFQNELLFGTTRVYLTRTDSTVWDPISFKLGTGVITALALDPTGGGVCYAGENDGQVFVTQNTGADNWPEEDTGLPSAQVNAFGVNPDDPTNAFVVFEGSGTTGGHIFETTDAGQHWTDISGNLPSVNTNTVVFDPTVESNAPNGTIFVGDDVGVYSSVDNGKTWQRLGVGLPNVPVVDLQLDTKLGELAAATQGAGVFTVSTDHSGPFVTSISAPTSVANLTNLTVVFNKPVNPATLTGNVTITDPHGNVITPSNIVELDPTTTQKTFQLQFAATALEGFYTITVNSTVADFNGNEMDQNHNGILGEAGDTFAGRVFWQPGNNAAPVLVTTAVSFGNIPENGTGAQVSGVSIPTLLAGVNITDANNPGAAVGIAVIGTDNANGDWQYSTDSGTTWNDFGIPAPAAARLLQSVPNNLIRFIPNSSYVGPTTFTFRAWDLTSGLTEPFGTDGGIANTTTNGGSTAFSKAIGTVTGQVIFITLPPTFTLGPTVSVFENSGANTIANFVTNINPGQPAQSGETVTFTATPADPTLFAVEPTIDTSGTLRFTPANDVSGSTTITVIGNNGGSTANGGNPISSPQTFTITIVFVNQPPTFVAGPNETTTVYSGPVSISNWATAISPGPANQAGETVSFIVSTNRPDLFTQQPTIDATTGTLSFAVGNGTIGVATVTVELMNNGGTANGGNPTSAPQTFTITVGALVPFGSANQVWISQVYRDVLGREIDPSGLSFYSGLLDNNVSRYDVGVAVVSSTEYQTDYINKIYQQALGRPVDATGLKYYLGLLAGGDTLVDVRARILASGEFYLDQKPAGPYAFLNGVYEQVFGHVIDPAGVQKWGTMLAATNSRYLVALAILTDPNALAVEVNNDFTAWLGHNASPDAVTFYVNELVAGFQRQPGGISEQGLLSSILATPEYSNKIIPNYDPTADKKWINQTFKDLLGFSADTNSLNIYTSSIRQGATRLQVVQVITRSQAFQMNFLTATFNRILSRNPSQQEMNTLLGALAGGATLEQIEAGLYGSAEYYNSRGQGNNFGYLTALYHDILGASQVDSTGLVNWGTQLAGGTAPQNVALAILSTPGAYQSLVGRYYFQYLRRSPDAGSSSFVNLLLGGARDEDVITDIVGSLEYYKDATK